MCFLTQERHNFQCYARQTNLCTKLTQLVSSAPQRRWRFAVSKQVVFSASVSRPSSSLHLLLLLLFLLLVSFPRGEVAIVGRPDFPEKGTATTTTGAFVYRPERIASCTQRRRELGATASTPRNRPAIYRSEIYHAPALESATAPPRSN